MLENILYNRERVVPIINIALLMQGDREKIREIG